LSHNLDFVLSFLPEVSFTGNSSKPVKLRHKWHIAEGLQDVISRSCNFSVCSTPATTKVKAEIMWRYSM